MRTLLFFTFFIVIHSNLFSQDALTTDNRIVGGGISFSRNNSEESFPSSIQSNPPNDRLNKLFGYSFSPYYGRFYKDFKMVGMRISVSGNNMEVLVNNENFESIDDTKQLSYSVGGFVRRYYPYSDRFGVFLDVGMDVNRSMNNQTFERYDLSLGERTLLSRNEQDSESFGVSADSEVGIYFFILNRLSIETRLARFFLSYNTIELTDTDVINDDVLEGDGNESNIDLRFINSFSFDQIFTINYYF